jgi:chaperonin cofactor prefoldin
VWSAHCNAKGVVSNRAEANDETRGEQRMAIDTNDLAKKAIHDKLESQINTAEAKLDTLKAQTQTAKANLEIKAIAELSPKTQVIRQKFQELKQSGGAQWQQAKTDLEARLADFEKSVKGIESKAKAN